MLLNYALALLTRPAAVPHSSALQSDVAGAFRSGRSCMRWLAGMGPEASIPARVHGGGHFLGRHQLLDSVRDLLPWGPGNGLGTMSGCFCSCCAGRFRWVCSALLAGVLVQRPYAALGDPGAVGCDGADPWLFHYTWLQLGNAGIDMSVPMRLAPFTGVYGLSFVFAALRDRDRSGFRFDGREKQLVWLAPLVLLAVLPPLPEPEKPTESAVSVQPNIRRTGRLDPGDGAQQLRSDGSRCRCNRPFRPETRIRPVAGVPAPVYYLEDSPFVTGCNGLARYDAGDRSRSAPSLKRARCADLNSATDDLPGRTAHRAIRQDVPGSFRRIYSFSFQRYACEDRK